MKSKKNSLELISKEVRPDLMCVSETMLKESEKPKMRGFVPFYKSRAVKDGGGIATFVAENIANKAVQTLAAQAEVMAVRLEHTRIPVTVISAYGLQDNNRSAVQSEFDEIVGEMTAAKARGDIVFVTGDLNRHVGDLIFGNDDKVSFGGQLWRNLLENGEFVLINGVGRVCEGGPFTWHQPGGHARSALSLWITCEKGMQHVEKLYIDDSKTFCPFRTTGKTGKTFTDHLTTILKLKGLNRVPEMTEETRWSTRKPGCWEKFYEESKKVGEIILKKFNSRDEWKVEDANKMFEKEYKNLQWKCFERVSVKSGGPQQNKRIIKDKFTTTMKMNRAEFDEAIERIREKGATVGKIYELKNIVHGRRRQQKQTPAAVKDPTTGELQFNREEIKRATVKHVKATLEDREPSAEYTESVERRKDIIEEAASVRKEERIQFEESEMRKVAAEMRVKGKECHKPITKCSTMFLNAILAMMNVCTKEEEIPKAYTQTSLTQLKKPKGELSSLSSYRFIHTKSFMPRALESLMTNKMKPLIHGGVSPYQLGGIQGSQPEEHLYTLKMMVDFFNSFKIPVWLSLYDMKAYFDVQRWDDSTVTLVDSNLKGPLLRLYIAVTKENRLRVASPAGMTEMFEAGPLTPQGSSYGALVSSLNLDKSMWASLSYMVEHISRMVNIPMRALLFQDDICKVSLSRAECQMSQDVISECIKSKQLLLNTGKCKVLVVGKFEAAGELRRNLKNDPIRMNGEVVESVDVEKYLGDDLKSTGVAESATSTIERRLREVAGPICEVIALAHDCRSAYIGPVHLAVTLWESIIVSKVITNASSWIRLSEKAIKILEQNQLDFLRRLLKLPRTTPSAGVWWETGVMPWKWRIIQKKMKFAQHLERRNSEALAAKLWKMEKENLTDGLLHEIRDWISKYNLPAPSPNVSILEYKRRLKKAVVECSRKEVWDQVILSKKLSYMAYWHQLRAPQMGMLDIKRISFITRCRLASTFEFSADFGSGVKCECGELDTMAHVRRGCRLYEDLLPHDMRDIQKVEVAESFFMSVLERKRRITEGWTPPPRSSCSSDGPPPTPPSPPNYHGGPARH